MSEELWTFGCGFVDGRMTGDATQKDCQLRIGDVPEERPDQRVPLPLLVLLVGGIVTARRSRQFGKGTMERRRDAVLANRRVDQQPEDAPEVPLRLQGGQHCRQLLTGLAHMPPLQLDEDGLLVGKVLIHGGDIYTGAFGDAVGREPAPAVLYQNVSCGLDNRVDGEYRALLKRPFARRRMLPSGHQGRPPNASIKNAVIAYIIVAMRTATAVEAAEQRWTAFCAVNASRRAIRDFDGTAVADEDVREILEQALLAPSSANLQPYEVHWIRDPATKRKVVAACRGQRAAASASVLLVVAASVATARRTASAQLAYVNATDALDEPSKRYHRGQLAKFSRFMRWGTLWIWGTLHAGLCVICPAFTLIPIGATATRHWAARSAVYAAQTVLLAAAARGLDSCPMEGFDARKMTKILRTPRGTVIPVVIAIGRRRQDARVEPRWRRAFANAVVIH